jgi:CspA family cold shock protein
MKTMASLAGTVKFFDPEKGYGFIQPDGGGPEVFLHGNAVKTHKLQGRMIKGQRVTFDAVPHRGAGRKAVNLATHP